MPHVLVTGSIGIDSVDTPSGSCRDCLGGSAVYFSLAAGLLCSVRLVGVVGDDFPDESLTLLQNANIDLRGLEVRPGGKTFRWHGRYSEDMNQRDTVDVQLNVLADRGPTIPEPFRDSECVFLANTDPILQSTFLDQVTSAELVVCDTMDLWINHQRDDLLNVLKRVDGLIINDSEARNLTGCSNLLAAVREIRALGPKYVVVKKGEHGAILYADGDVLVLPAFLTENVVDPTGAGDSFAGGLMGYLTRQQARRDDPDAWRTALVYATVVASFSVEAFSVDGLTGLDPSTLEQRMKAFNAMIQPGFAHKHDRRKY